MRGKNLRRVELVYELMFRCGHVERFHVRWPETKRATALLRRRAIVDQAIPCADCEERQMERR